VTAIFRGIATALNGQMSAHGNKWKNDRKYSAIGQERNQKHNGYVENFIENLLTFSKKCL